MKKFLPIVLLLVSAWAWGQKLPPKPNPPRLVNDLTNKLLTADQIAHLEQKLVAYDDSTSIQIAVVVVDALDDYDPADYATNLGRAWGVGNKKTNNGVVFLISTEPQKRKIFIAPGYGLEGVLPDILCKRIVEEVILPQFRQEHYYRGIDLGVESIIKASRGEYKAPEGYRKKGKDGGGVMVFIIILILVIFIMGGINRGGPGGGMMSRRGYRNFTGPVMWFPGGGGGGRGGGGWSGGGGGGFGGFGGGSFGGGGAGGSW